MKTKNIVEGINIINKYIPKDEEYVLQVGHDILFFGEYDWVTDRKDVKQLEELGWFEEEDAWACFV